MVKSRNNARHSKRGLARSSKPCALSVLPPALEPVIQIAGRARICFVLLMLLGYAAAACAQMLDIGESGPPALLLQAETELAKSFRSWPEASGPRIAGRGKKGSESCWRTHLKIAIV